MCGMTFEDSALCIAIKVVIEVSHLVGKKELTCS